jgi:adenosylmethionine-8-amino-7-oxononanoate aminotransferase
MCGMGRTGTLHAWEQEGVVPDIQAVAKGLGGGYAPIGATLVSGKIAQAMRDGSGIVRHGHTYMAHPLGCAAALAVQHVIREEGLLERVRSLGQLLEKRLVERFGNHHHVGDVRGRGLFHGIEIVADRASKAPFDPALKMHARIKRAALERGLACYPGGGTIDGFKGDHVLLAPPYICTPGEIEMIVERLGEAVDAAVKDLAH